MGEGEGAGVGASDDALVTAFRVRLHVKSVAKRPLDQSSGATLHLLPRNQGDEKDVGVLRLSEPDGRRGVFFLRASDSPKLLCGPPAGSRRHSAITVLKSTMRGADVMAMGGDGYCGGAKAAGR